MHTTAKLNPDFPDDQWQISPMIEVAGELQSQSDWTWRHSGRVARYAVAIGKKLGLSREDMLYLQTAAILHDVGKLSVPVDLLEKTTPLSRDEWYSITKHPMSSSKLLKAQALPVGMTRIAQSHHEWYDGTGYPLGLAGESIPLGARILSIADSYDAMSSNRPYRAALAPEQIAAEFEKGAGRQFDPTLVRRLRGFLSSGADKLVPTYRMRVISDDPELYMQIWFAAYPHGWNLEAWPQIWGANCPTGLLTARHDAPRQTPDLTVIDNRCYERIPERALERLPESTLLVDPASPAEHALYRPLDLAHTTGVLKEFEPVSENSSPGTRPLPVLIADPYQLFRQAVRRCLEASEEFEIVGEVDSPAGFRKAVSEKQCAVAIVASDLLEGTSTTRPLRPGDVRLDTSGNLTSQFGGLPTIVLIADEDLEDGFATRLQATDGKLAPRAYLPRGAPAEVLVQTIRSLVELASTED